jgi:hypothetical protein
MPTCNVRDCQERVTGGFKAHRDVSTLDRDGILPISVTSWCEEHEATLREKVRGPGTFFSL